ncbi:RUN domain-containing protein, partial [Aphelenchoides avenae]
MRPQNEQPLPKRCVCGKDCANYVLRCDHCQRGVHLHCIGMTKSEAGRLILYVCDSCKHDGVDVAAVRMQREAEGKPRAVVFKVTCDAHANGGQYRHGITVTPIIDYAPDETFRRELP